MVIPRFMGGRGRQQQQGAYQKPMANQQGAYQQGAYNQQPVNRMHISQILSLHTHIYIDICNIYIYIYRRTREYTTTISSICTTTITKIFQISSVSRNWT
eukprot:226087_1